MPSGRAGVQHSPGLREAGRHRASSQPAERIWACQLCTQRQHWSLQCVSQSDWNVSGFVIIKNFKLLNGCWVRVSWLLLAITGHGFPAVRQEHSCCWPGRGLFIFLRSPYLIPLAVFLLQEEQIEFLACVGVLLGIEQQRHFTAEVAALCSAWIGSHKSSVTVKYELAAVSLVVPLSVDVRSFGYKPCLCGDRFPELQMCSGAVMDPWHRVEPPVTARQCCSRRPRLCCC